MKARYWAVAITGLLSAGCVSLQGRDGADGTDGPHAAATPAYSAELMRSAYGVPHVIADDYGGVGYGLGYAAAQDNACMIFERDLTLRGERARYLGAGEDGANLASDL